MNAVDQIKSKWTLRSMAARLGVELPERDGVKFRNPFRPDQTPSCTVKGELIFDWSQGDGKPIDVIGLYALAKGLDNRQAIAELAAEIAPTPEPTTPSRKLEVQRPARPPFQSLNVPTLEELQKLAECRNIYLDALECAAKHGHLFFADTNEGRAYVVTDRSRRVCQSRRLDGHPWSLLKSKAWTSVKEFGFAGWPLGAEDIGDREQVILCEGGPDWLVAHEAEPEAAVCTMLGAKQSIHPDALAFFTGKRVRILGHGDTAGAEACKRWALQLSEVGAIPTAVLIKFGSAEDLNDCVGLPAEDFRRFKISHLLAA